MQSAIDLFRISIARVRDLIAVHNSLKAQASSVLDLSDMLRASLVLAVSALDYYIHEVVRIGMLEIHRGQRPEPPAFSGFQISLGSARAGINAGQNIDSWLEDEIRQRHSYKSFQQPNAIADAVRLICDKKLWEEVSSNMGSPAKDIKQQLSRIVDRRNKIAHEADIDPSYPIGDRWPIDELLVNEAVDFLEQVVESIHKIL
ncbi:MULTISPECIES: HEPN domain-containing protein [unclassified Microcoleus]|uniref:HEPN domain-containing protein n=1 Tax=unclassified Microcoleus TaxID=2642155 RepID=UPI0025FB32CF|nr:MULTISPECIES: HEPN domain-containing protein [unclassified Microcoleus]